MISTRAAYLIGCIGIGMSIGNAVSIQHLKQHTTEQPQPAPTISASPVAPGPRATPTTASRSRPLATSSATRRTTPPRGATGPDLNWAALRRCESSGNYHDRDSLTYRGAYQFDQQTWQSVGGTGDPADASPAEQDSRALRLYARRGRQPWPVCGRRL